MTEIDRKRDSNGDSDGSRGGVKKVKITDFFSKKTPGEEMGKVQQKVEEQKEVDIKENELAKELVEEKSVDAVEVTTDATQDVDDVTEDVAEDISFKQFTEKYGFDKQKWINTLSPEVTKLLDLEIKYLHITWLTFLHKELTKPYFLKLKRFLKAQDKKTVFPPKDQIYSWSHHTPLPDVKCLILGQDPYHNFNQAHGLAFSVLEPTKPPPSLKNIYKGLVNDYPKFQAPDSSKGGGGNLTKWAKRGVFMLNTCLTVEAHKPNSHSKQGWETFTLEVIKTAVQYHSKQTDSGFVVMAWGMPAQKTVSTTGLDKQNKFLIIKTFHPSPFSAAKGFFTSESFKRCNEWLQQQGKRPIDWSLVDGNDIF